MGIFDSFAQMNGLTESAAGNGYSAVDEAAILEEMEKLEEMPPANLVSEDPYDACFEAMMINESNYNNIMMAIAHEEMSYFIENGTEMVYESGRAAAVLDRVKELLDKAWAKIKEVFNKVLKTIDSWVSTDKRFVDKHEKTIKASSEKARTIMNTYDIKYEGIADTAKYTDISSRVSKFIHNTGSAAMYKDIDASAKRFGQEIMGTETSAQYRSKLESEYGLDKTGSAKIPAAEIISELTNGKTNKKNVKKAHDNAKRAISEMKRDVDKKKSELTKKGDYTSTDDDGTTRTNSIGACSKACSIGITALNTIQSVQIKAMNVHHSNCRKAAARAVRGVKEGFEFEDDDNSVSVGGSYSYIQ